MLHKCHAPLCNSSKHHKSYICESFSLVCRMMKLPTTMQRTMWVFIQCFFLLFAFSFKSTSHSETCLILPLVPYFPSIIDLTYKFCHLSNFFLLIYNILKLFPAVQALLCLFFFLFSHVASSLSSFLPLPLRWRGLCHVSPLIDRWDVWAGYTVALLGSKCSHHSSLPPSFFLSQDSTDSTLFFHFFSCFSLYISLSPLLSLMEIVKMHSRSYAFSHLKFRLCVAPSSQAMIWKKKARHH